MGLTGYRATFVRGGTSKGLVFNRSDLPDKQELWAPIFLAAMGSPDASGRQLDGMGGGLSSLSKVCVVGPSTRTDADVDYTFAQVMVKEAVVDYTGNCGNMSSAIGPFAVQEGLVDRDDGPVLVRIHNTNTGKIIHSEFAVEDGSAVSVGNMAIPGVSGSGAPIKLTFIDPGGSATGLVLPTGSPKTLLDLTDGRTLQVSLVDAGNPCVFVRAGDLGLLGSESPRELEEAPGVLDILEEIRVAASLRMGLTGTAAEAKTQRAMPLVGIVAPARSFVDQSGENHPASDHDLTVRMISSGHPHRALPVTGALCTVVASSLPGCIPYEFATLIPNESVGLPGSRPLRLGMPSGILQVESADGSPGESDKAPSAAIFRTTRVLMRGEVLLRATADIASETVASRRTGHMTAGLQKEAEK